MQWKLYDSNCMNEKLFYKNENYEIQIKKITIKTRDLTI